MHVLDSEEKEYFHPVPPNIVKIKERKKIVLTIFYKIGMVSSMNLDLQISEKGSKYQIDFTLHPRSFPLCMHSYAFWFGKCVLLISETNSYSLSLVH